MAHLRTASNEHLTGHKANSRFLLVFACGAIPSLVILLFKHVQTLKESKK
jgi:hypothetical protein